MSERYWVVGGEYTDTRFAEIVGGGPERRLGPFDSYPEAKAVWRAKAMETIDDAHARWSIEKEDAREYWVVGGSYTGTDFREITGGGAEERHGPFASYDEAKAVWRGRAQATVDDTHARYRIESI